MADEAQVVAVHREAQLGWRLAGAAESASGQAADAGGTHDVHPRKAVPAPEDQLRIGVEEGVTEAFVGGEADFEERWGAQGGEGEEEGEGGLGDGGEWMLEGEGGEDGQGGGEEDSALASHQRRGDDGKKAANGRASQVSRVGTVGPLGLRRQQQADGGAAAKEGGRQRDVMQRQHGTL
nr:hypothetical protein [Anaerolineae bacterium]